jgi:glycosyltransferase involved in cell wall biosynthesis
VKIVSVLTSQLAGGAEFAAVALLDALCSRGHEAVILSDVPGIARGTRVQERPIALGPKLGRRTFFRLAARWPAMRRRLIRALDDERDYDVLLLHFKKEQLVAATLPRRLRPTLAWAEWGPVPFPMRRGLPGRLYRRAARDVRAVLCVSEGTRRSVVEAGVPAARVHVVPNIVSAETIGFRPSARVDGRAALGLPPDAFVVGCMTRFHPKKRNDVLIDAVLRLADPRVHLVFAGAGETEGELRRRAAPLGERAHFLPTPGDAACEVLSAWDLAVFCPSPTEGAPLAIIVSMLCERPVVSTGAEGALDLIRPGTGVIAQPDHDPAAVAAAIAAYRDDPERVRRDGRQARCSAAELHDADAVAARAEVLLALGRS